MSDHPRSIRHPPRAAEAESAAAPRRLRGAGVARPAARGRRGVERSRVELAVPREITWPPHIPTPTSCPSSSSPTTATTSSSRTSTSTLDADGRRIGGAPGAYTLDQIRALPKQTHNTRHVCVEGWDVVGTLRRRAAARLPHAGRRGSGGALSDGDVRGRLLRVARHRDRAASAVAALLRDVRPSARSRARRAAAAEPARPSLATSRRSTS